MRVVPNRFSQASVIFPALNPVCPVAICWGLAQSSEEQGQVAVRLFKLGVVLGQTAYLPRTEVHEYAQEPDGIASWA